MQTFTGQFNINEKMFDLRIQILFHESDSAFIIAVFYFDQSSAYLLILSYVEHILN